MQRAIRKKHGKILWGVAVGRVTLRKCIMALRLNLKLDHKIK